MLKEQKMSKKYKRHKLSFHISNDIIRFRYSWQSFAFTKLSQSGAKRMNQSMDECMSSVSLLWHLYFSSDFSLWIRGKLGNYLPS